MPTKKKPTTTAGAKHPAAPARRRELLDRAATVFADLGYNATTVRRIADDAGMLAGSLYYYFESKDAMLEEILRTFLDELWEGYDAVLDAELRPRETFEALVVESFRAIDRHRAAVARQGDRGVPGRPGHPAHLPVRARHGLGRRLLVPARRAARPGGDRPAVPVDGPGRDRRTRRAPALTHMR